MATNWIVVTLKVKEGKHAELEAVVKDLAAQVRANEPNVPVYTFTRNKADPNTYVFVEHYLTPEARDAHGKTDYFRAAGPKLAACLVERPSILDLETII